MTVDGSAATNGIKIDLSGLEGYATSTITGVGSKADTLIGGVGADKIIAGVASFDAALVDTLTGGAGDDTFVAGKTAAGETTENNITVTTVITDFASSEDGLAFTGGAAGSDANFVSVATQVDVAAFVTAALAELSTTVLYVAGTVGKDTYVLHGSGTANEADALVHLQGVENGIEYNDIVAPA